MPLTKRQRRRLKEVSRMIESTITIKDDMVDIQLQYANEIDDVIKKLTQKNEDTEPLVKEVSELSTNIAEESLSDSQETTGSTGEPPSDANFEPPPRDDIDVPPWAKMLWKKIAMKCHPDRLNFQKLSAIEIARRQEFMVQARDVYELAKWNKLLHIGIQVEEWTEELTSMVQLEMLNTEYTTTTTIVEKIKESLAWTWGTNWTNTELRVQIINIFCQHKGLPVPEKKKLIEIIQNLETD